MNLNNMTQLSIITINKNDAKGLEKTLESIWKSNLLRILNILLLMEPQPIIVLTL